MLGDKEKKGSDEMFAIPLRLSSTHYTLCIVLEDENLERMKEHDPAEIPTALLGEPWSNLAVKDVVMLYASPEEAKQALTMCQQGRGIEAMRNLSRGWRYRPDQGDSDDPYKSLLFKTGL